MKILYSLDDPALPLQNTAVALGVFDGIHLGHMAVLRLAVDEARARGLAPCVFTFALADPPPAFKPGAAQLTTPSLMARLFHQLGMAYAIALPFDAVRGKSGEEFIREVLKNHLGARFVCCGYNFSFGKNRGSHAEDLAALASGLGMDSAVAPEVDLGGEPVSSTRIRREISCGNIPEANALLGRPFSIDFPVVDGNRIGRTLGTPTINQPFPPSFALPRFGVYATIAQVDGAYYSGVTNVGTKPTVGRNAPLAETYIQGFSGDLYGKRVEVAFLEFIRPERKFASLEELRAHILQDAGQAAAIGARFLTDII